ncbi:MAG: 4Fe-4S dicluster domain-containing protein [Deltaproteobacteria bacterium]|nr:4Fe-4S dicluster domain-containing protein [Deltaproteobacteria bacterium]
MPTTRDQSKDKINKEIADYILKAKEPPVARFRLLSRGMEPYHRLFIRDPNSDVIGDKGCLACGNCIDSCPVLRKDAKRFEKTEQRTSFALEACVGEDCEQCYSCVLACPQVDTAYKDYIVDEVIPETIQPAPRITSLDNYFMALMALIIGIVIGVFLAR